MKKLLISIPLLTVFTVAHAEEMTFQVEEPVKKEIKTEPKAKKDTKEIKKDTKDTKDTKDKAKTNEEKKAKPKETIEKKSTAKGKKPVDLLKTFLKNTKTLTAKFKQVVLDKNDKVSQTSEGLFYLSRPGKFRWYYHKPFIQEIVSNSGKVWFYDADLEQVTIKKLDKSMGASPALLLSGKVDIEKEYNLKSQGETEGLHWIKLIPKSEESTFKYVLIGLSKGVLGGMELSDNFGQLTRIYFSDVKINPKLKEKEFIFTIPKGADVFEDKGTEKKTTSDKKQTKKDTGSSSKSSN